ncbi:stage V sporulation protein AB [Brevibacillus daliensis]|uniref:stage V sporulation protein AB n=1 Tax=Brevibacillus daliensis TaxID=2892995 RepID=UPI001E51DD79|nr:stage V sporulation protein AB [Brevibacillus daliensis]
MILSYIIIFIVGLGWGIAVGSGFVAFISVLDIIPRLTQITGSKSYMRYYEWAIIAGTFFFTTCDFMSVQLMLPPVLSAGVSAGIGIFEGIFVGMLAAGLAEVLNVFPIITKRLQLHDYMRFFLLAVVFGKVMGSLVQWVIL